MKTNSPQGDRDQAPAPHRARRCSLLLVLSAAILAACADTHGLKPSAQWRDAPAPQATAALAARELGLDAWPTRSWWTRYGDTQLNTIMADALAGNPSLDIAQARVRQAAALAGLTEAAQQIQVSAAAKSSRQLFSAHAMTPKPMAGEWGWINEATVNLSYDLDFWNKNRSALQAAVGRLKATEVESYGVQLALTTTIMHHYIRLQQLYQQKDIALASLKQRESTLTLTQQRALAKIDSAVEIKQAESLIPAAQLQIVQLDEAMQLTRTELAALMGKGPDAGLHIDRPALTLPKGPLLPTSVPAEFIGRRPDVIAQRWRAQAAGHEIDVAHAQFYPNISLTAFIGLQSIGFSNFDVASSRIVGAGPALNLPIFDGGRLRSNLALRDAEYDISVELYNATVIEAVRDVVSQLVSIRSMDDQRRLQAQATLTAQQAYDLAQQRYKAGVGNYLQVLAAQAQLLTTQRQLVDLDIRSLELNVSLTKALGGGYGQNG